MIHVTICIRALCYSSLTKKRNTLFVVSMQPLVDLPGQNPDETVTIDGPTHTDLVKVRLISYKVCNWIVVEYLEECG